MMDRDEIRVLREFAAFTWFIGMLYHAGDRDIHAGVWPWPLARVRNLNISSPSSGVKA